MIAAERSRRYLTFGKRRLRVPRRRGLRIALGLVLLVRGLPPPAGPVLLPAELTLPSMDVALLRRLRRRLLVRAGRWWMRLAMGPTARRFAILHSRKGVG